MDIFKKYKLTTSVCFIVDPSTLVCFVWEINIYLFCDDFTVAEALLDTFIPLCRAIKY
jgi:hypothetical protein